jgi:hypothetical protein
LLRPRQIVIVDPQRYLQCRHELRLQRGAVRDQVGLQRSGLVVLARSRIGDLLNLTHVAVDIDALADVADQDIAVPARPTPLAVKQQRVDRRGLALSRR